MGSNHILLNFTKALVLIFLPVFSYSNYIEINNFQPTQNTSVLKTTNASDEIHSTDLTIIPSVQSVSCYGEFTGEINLSVTGGSGIYSFKWDNGEFTKDISGLMAGIYNVTVMDSEGDTKSLDIEVFQPEQLNLEASVTHIGFSSDSIGSIDLTVTGGVGPYLYEWTGPNGFSAVSQDISNLESGTYSVVVIDANGCLSYLVELVSKREVDYFMAPPQTLFFDCIGDELPMFNTYNEFVNAGGYVKSDCSVDASTFRGEEISRKGKCPTTITRRYWITDDCGKDMVCFHTISIDDNTNPRFPINP